MMEPSMSARRPPILLPALVLAAGLTVPALAAERKAPEIAVSGGLQPTMQMAEVRSESAGLPTGSTIVEPASKGPAATVLSQGSIRPTAAPKVAAAWPASTGGRSYAARPSSPSLILGVRF
jgi:hypothetical protein